jgi:hypothetical protein
MVVSHFKFGVFFFSVIEKRICWTKSVLLLLIFDLVASYFKFDSLSRYFQERDVNYKVSLYF